MVVFVYSYICACKWVKAFKDAHPPLPEMISKAHVWAVRTCESAASGWPTFKMTSVINDAFLLFSSLSLSLSLFVCRHRLLMVIMIECFLCVLMCVCLLSTSSTMKFCCKEDQEFMNGIPATVVKGRMATVWFGKDGKPDSTMHICDWTRKGRQENKDKSKCHSKLLDDC